MADPIPAVDAALLAAQARAGQAGVDAYKAATAELQKQRQMSVEQAMQEAALRGAPVGAAQQVQSIATAPYDQRIASLTQADAAFQGDMAGRDRRMADYNAAVNAARSYIPQVTEQMVAPIRAEGEYRVRGIERSGEAKVSEIGANQRLIEAKMAAEFQAAQIAAAKAASDAAGEAGKKPSLTKTELEGELAGRARQRLQQSSTAARDIIEGNQSEVRAVTDKKKAAVRGGAKGTVARNRMDAITRALSTFLSQQMGLQVAQLQPKDTPFWNKQQTPAEVAANAARVKELERGMSSLKFRSTKTAEDTERREHLANSAVTSTRTGAERVRSFVDPTTGRRVMMTPQQFSMFDEFDRDSLLGATNYGPLNTGADIDQYLVGAPGERGIAHPYSAQVMRNAMIQAAQDMVGEGYEINDAELRNALGDAESFRPGQSLYDSLARESGQPTGEEEYQMGEDMVNDERQDVLDSRSDANWNWTQEGRVGEMINAESDVNQDRATADAHQALISRYGHVPASRFGTELEVATRVANDPSFRQSEDILRQILTDLDINYIDDEVEERMREESIPINDLALLKDLYSD
jgi:hypothetical protein